MATSAIGWKRADVIACKVRFLSVIIKSYTTEHNSWLIEKMIRELTFLGLTVGTYSLMAVIAAVTCAVMSLRPLRRCGLSLAGVAVLLSAMCIAFIVGARLWNVAVNPDSYDDTRPWYTLRMTGFSMYGGIAGAFIVILFAAGITRIRLVKIADALTIPGAVAFSIARIGCFLNGCCAGKNTDLPWGVRYPSSAESVLPSMITVNTYAVHPTQLYELILALIGIPLCLWLVKRFRAGDGGRFFIYGVWFSTMRLAILPLRSLPYSLLINNLIYPLIYYVLIVIGVFFFVWSCIKSRQTVSVENSGSSAPRAD